MQDNSGNHSSRSTPQTIYLKDYRPPDYRVSDIYLTFTLVDDATIVKSSINIYRAENIEGKPPLFLNGEDLELLSCKVNGDELGKTEYELTGDGLTILEPAHDQFNLEIETRINPAGNTSLSGLYQSSGNFCTQCEAEGFRRMTYFLDRPDVMTKFTTRLIADKIKYPVLLSNGDCVARGDFDDACHWAEFVDPYPKPSYLFALVAGDLSCIEDDFTTASGKQVRLSIYVEHHNIDKCSHAMASLKNSMKWDEQTYGCEYDLNTYVIVAVDDFNMGAMENKGLNVFNSKYVLAKPETATDRDYQGIEGVIGHEYFHNWSGNRVTCRDWFQLSLKEGFTVFRDQEFSADMTSRSVKRIEDVNQLRTMQFREDAGPISHAVRPESYVEINNFYTVTIYEKGAEVVRMLHNLLGKAGFRKGTDLYFKRHDGQAVTTDDFVKALEDANDVDFSQFRLWYSQSGTPVLNVKGEYNAENRTYNLTLSQSCPDTPGQTNKKPFHIPVSTGLLDSNGDDLPLKLQGEEPAPGSSVVLQLKSEQETFCFEDVPCKPVPSVLRGFSAPVKVIQELDDDDLCFLMSNDSDGFNRWEAGQQLYIRNIIKLVNSVDSTGKQDINSNVIGAVLANLNDKAHDKSLLAQAITLPSEEYVSEYFETVDPVAIHQARMKLKKQLANSLSSEFMQVYKENINHGTYSIDHESIAGRSLKNSCLGYLMELDAEEVLDLCLKQYHESNNMTDNLAAFFCLVNKESNHREAIIDDFYTRWEAEPLVIDKWLAIQATSRHPETIERVRALTKHDAFSLKNPNKVRALIGAFTQGNQLHFHSANGEGYQFLGDKVIELDALNPQIASRLSGGFNYWKRFDSDRQAKMKEQLIRISEAEGLSKDVYEIVSKSLGR